MTDFNFDDFTPDEEPEFVANLDTLRELAQSAIETRVMIDELEQQAKELKDYERNILEKLIPRGMEELGITRFDLKDGNFITVKEDVTCGQLDETKPHFEFAKQWLIDHDAADLLKTEVKMEFGKGQHNEAMSVVADLRDQGYDAIARETIHSQTYKSHGNTLLKEYHEGLKHGEDVEVPPFEALGMYVVKAAKIKQGKK